MPRFKRYIAEHEDGRREEFVGFDPWCRKMGFSDKSARNAMYAERRYKGWLIKPAPRGEAAADGDKGFMPSAVPPPDMGGCPVAIELSDPPEKLRDKIREALAWLVNKDMEYASRRGGPPEWWDAGKVVKNLEVLAKTSGINWKDIADQRTPEDKALDAAVLIAEQGDEMFAIDDETIAVLERGMSEIAERGEKYWERINERAAGMTRGRLLGLDTLDPGEPAGPKHWAEAARRWLDRFRRIRALRHQAKVAYDPGRIGAGQSEIVQRATHLLRFMIYVGRSDLQSKSPADSVYKIGEPQIRMSMDIWLAERGYGDVEGVGMLAPGETNPHTGQPFDGIQYSGIVIQAPPRHSKTDTVKMDQVLRINENPSVQMAYIHDNDDFASSRLSAVRKFYEPGTKQGRRNLSLYPAKLAKYDNNAHNMRVDNPQPPISPNLVAHGINVSRTGINLDILYGDDTVPPDDVFQPTERERRIQTWNRTWVTRLQGANPFIIMTGYPQHHDDLLCYYEKQGLLAARTNCKRGIPLWITKMPVGGPNSSPPFRPIMPELYDSAYLRRRYHSIGDPSTWSSNYELKALDDRDRDVKEPGLYDMTDASEMATFMATAEIHVGLDPAYKGKEGSDKAGMVIVALGTKTWVEQRAAGSIMRTDEQIRIIEEDEFHATQDELNENVLSLGATHNVHCVHIETNGSLGSTMVDSLENIYGISAVRRFDVSGAGSKHERLKRSASLLENKNPQFPAKVLFPGRPVEDDGETRLVLDESMQRLHDYVVSFRTTSGHHSLDALTMLCFHLRDRVSSGVGPFSSELAESERRGDQRILDLFKRANHRRRLHGARALPVNSQGV